MAIIQSGAGSTTATVEVTQAALRTVDRPVEALTWISLGALSGLVTSLSNGSPVFSLRNSGTNTLLVRRVGVGFSTTTAFTTAQPIGFNLIAARAYTVSDTGGTAITISGNNAKMRTSLPAPTSLDVRISTTGALNNGTKTFDSNSLAMVLGGSTGIGTGVASAIDNLLKHDPGDYPLVLAPNEGISIQNLITFGATGVGYIVVNIEFAEVTTF